MSNTDFASACYTAGQLNDVVKMMKKQAGDNAVERFLHGELVVSETKKSVSESTCSGIITINRGSFNTTKFIGYGWSINVGETDEHSTTLTELDFAKVQLVTMLKDGETYITGEEKLSRLKESGNIRLDADVFFTLWNNQSLIPESWKGVNGNILYISFDGTIFWSLCGYYVLRLYWYGGRWVWGADWLGSACNARHLSVVLAN